MTIKSAITLHHEALLREKAENNRKLQYLHVKTIGLTRRMRPVLSGITHTQEVVRARIHIKIIPVLFHRRLKGHILGAAHANSGQYEEKWPGLH